MVVFNLVPNYLEGGTRQYQFKVGGLQEVEQQLKKLNIPFILVHSQKTDKELLQVFKKHKAGAVVTDFCPLKIADEWIKTINKAIDIPLYQVDAHNIVPCWEASPKQEFAAYTIRPKIHRKLGIFLDEFPSIKKQTIKHGIKHTNEWGKILKAKTDDSVKPVTWIKPGEKAARKMLKSFIDERLKGYAEKRNDPTEDHLSQLSPYLHYGHIAPQRVALEIQKHDHDMKSQDAFLEELIVRRELSDNYCFYNKNYDNPKGYPDWAKKTHAEHDHDPREYTYTLKQFEQAKTHDELWNAAQMEMVKTGKMHGYMRMYWAKKIFEWTPSAAKAQKVAIYLNDKYELDGRDPNGYVGIAWSIGGVHDRAWFERPIFGKIRYMSYNGCKRKFDIEAYIQKVNALP